MDPLTHALSGALVARATAPSAARNGQPGLRMRIVAATAAAVFPDIDFVLRLFGTLTYLNQHQGFTHSLALLPLWAPLLAMMFALAVGKLHWWRPLLAPVTLGLLAHIGGDIVTAYGLQLFAPLSDMRLAWPLVFVIDPVVTGVLTAGLLLSLRTRAGRSAAVIALGCVVAYFSFLAQQHRAALELASAHAARLGAHSTVTALPQPFSLFNWMLIVERGDAWHVARVNLRRLDGAPATSWWPWIAGRMDAAYISAAPDQWLEVPRFGSADDVAFAREAWQHDSFAAFRRFARFGRLLEITSDETQRCAWFADLRFEMPELEPSFRFGACQQHASPQEWELVRARGRFWID